MGTHAADLSISRSAALKSRVFWSVAQNETRHAQKHNKKKNNDTMEFRSFPRRLLLVAFVISSFSVPCEAASSRGRGARILGAPVSVPRALAESEAEPNPVKAESKEGDTESTTTPTSEAGDKETSENVIQSVEAKTCSGATDCDNCYKVAVEISLIETSKTCRWLKVDDDDDDSSKSCQSVDSEKAGVSIENMCSASVNLKEGDEEKHSSETGAPTGSPTQPTNPTPTKSPVDDFATAESATEPDPGPKEPLDGSNSEPTKDTKPGAVDVSTAEPTKAPTMKPVPATEKPNEPAGEPTVKKTTPAPTKKPAPEPEHKSHDADDAEEGENATTSSTFVLGDVDPKQIGAVTFSVVLFLFLFRCFCCRRPSSTDHHKGPTTASMGPRSTPSTYSRVAIADPIEEDNADDWGWDDNNIENNTSGDLEMSRANTSSHGKTSPPPPSFNSSQASSSRVTAGVSLENPEATPTTATRAGITLSSRGVNKKSTPAKTVQDPNDIFSQMGLAAKPKFAKSAGPRKLGAVPLPKNDSDDWGSDDLDDLLDD